MIKSNAEEPQIKKTIINDKYLAAIGEYENALVSLDELCQSDYLIASSSGPSQARDQAADLIKSIRIPVSVQLAECYLKADRVKPDKSIETATRVLATNTGHLPVELDSEDIGSMLAVDD